MPEELIIDHLTIVRKSGDCPINIGLHSPIESYEDDISLDISEIKELIKFLERAIE